MSKHLPYGYKLDKQKHLVLEQQKAPFVKAIFEKYIEGISQMDIMKWLIEIKAPPTKVDSKWSHSIIGHILANSKYSGAENFPPIITKEMFLEVQQKRHKNNRYLSSYYNNTPYLKSKKYTFTGRIVCGECNKTCISHIICTGKPFEKHVWHCGNYRLNGRVACRIGVVEEELEQLFIEAFSELYNKLEILIKKASRIEKPKINNSISEIDRQIKVMLQQVTPDRVTILDLLKKRTEQVWDIAVVDDFEYSTLKLREVLNSLSEVPQYFDGDLFNSVIKQVTLYPTGKVAFIFLNDIIVKRDYNDYGKRVKGDIKNAKECSGHTS